MSIVQKINAAIKQMSVEEIDTVSQQELKQLTQPQVRRYINRAQELRRNYYINMIVDIDPPLGHWKERYGTFVTWLVFNQKTNQWEIKNGAGLVPTFATPPLMVTEENFRKCMKELRVPEDLINMVTKGHPVIS